MSAARASRKVENTLSVSTLDNDAVSLGTGNARNGLFARPAGTLEPQAAKIVSFCDTGDVFCASGTSTIIHLSYVNKYKADASNFVLDKIGN